MAGKKKKKEIKDFEENSGQDKILPNLKEAGDILSLKNERTRKALGFFLMVLSAALLISFISFFFSWSSDQGYLANKSYSEYQEINGSVENALGLLGARLGYIFIQNGFGFSAFLLLPTVLLLGIWLFFDYKPFIIIRVAIHSLLLMALLSLGTAFIFKSWYPLIGGAFGYFGIVKLTGLIGTMGTFLFMLVYAVLYCILFLNLNPFDKLNLPFFMKMKEKLKATRNQDSPSTNEDIAENSTDFELNVLGETEGINEPIHLDPLPPIKIKSVEPDPIEEQSNEITLDTKPIATAKEEESAFEIEDNTKKEEKLVKKNDPDKKDHFGIDTEFDPKLELSNYIFPTLDLLQEYDQIKQEIDVAEIEKSKNLIVQTLSNYKIGISKIKASVGPTVTLYEIVPSAGVKISKIKNLEDDIALSLAALGIRIIAPIPGKGTIGIEVPNKNPEMVPMKTVLASSHFQDSEFQLPVALGKTISNEIFIADLAKMPHLLMAGATGQGKSVGLNAILVSLLYKKHPAYIKFVLVDPKKVELTLFNKIERHYLAKLPGEGDAIITDNAKVINTLNSLCVEMDDRYSLLQDAMVRNIVEYNTKFINRKLNPENGHRFMPYIVVVIDEVADLMMTAGKEIETPIARLAQLARAIGIHLILATQRPSVNVITGMIKANFPSRIAFRVTSKIDSRTILDANGADQLIGKGDMLYSGGNETIRLQCPFVDTPEVERICDFIGEQRAFPSALILPEVKEEASTKGEGFDPNERDELFEDAARLIVNQQTGSTSLIQRKLKLGYNRAGRLMDQLEDAGIVGPSRGSKPRNVNIPDEYALEQFLQNLN
ncbi:DNA translocase FtsK [Bacteroidia bacterium]|nr:DNA translocase FtsK [Bacteroidia bacterium]